MGKELKILPIQFSRFGSVLLGSMNQYGDTNFFFSRLDPFLILSSELLLKSFERCYGENLPSDGLLCWPRISRDLNFWEARGAEEATAIGLD